MIKINNFNFDCTIEDIIEKLQIELKTRGSHLLHSSRPVNGYLMVSCPYHNDGNERRPSAQFRNEDGLFYCHACKECHSLPDVITYCLHENGWNWLRKNFLNDKVIKRDINLDFNKINKKKNIKYIDKSELDKYRFIHSYILNRGISKDVIRKYDIGYDKDFNLTTYDKNGNKKYNHIGECITFPVKDINGNILFIARRSIYGKTYHYPYGVDKPIYGLYEINKFFPNCKSVIICESMINALTCVTYGKPAIALNGTGSYSQIQELKKLPFREYILGLDPDTAGEKGKEKIKKNLLGVKILKELIIPKGKDINDLSEEEFKSLEIKNI